jgi:hypothetical protein
VGAIYYLSYNLEGYILIEMKTKFYCFSLATAMDGDPSFMLSSARVLQMAPASRDLISSAISQHCGKVKNVVFAILVIS